MSNEIIQIEVEEWRPVVDYDGEYSVSNLGRLRRDRDSHRFKAGRVLSPAHDRYGYPVVGIRFHGARKTIKVHHLVAAAFIGPRQEGMTVNHKDGVKTNNRIENLEYLTNLENMRHAHRNGLMHYSKGENHYSHTHPEKVARGDRSGARLHPERVARGDRNGARTHPERVPRGDKHLWTTLKDADIPRLFELRAAGLSLTKIGEIVGISRPQVGRILIGKSRRPFNPKTGEKS